MKAGIKRWLDDAGWFVRKRAGLAFGTDLYLDLARLGAGEPDLVLDIGAHIGESALEYAAHFPAARVIAFEPVEANYRKLVANVAGQSRIQGLQLALGDAPGTARIALQDNTQGHSLTMTADQPDGASEEIAVDTLDAVMARQPAASRVFIKIDAEGYELNILAGAAATLRDASVRAILCESTLDPDDPLHTPLAKLQDALGAYGFRLTSILEQTTFGAPAKLAFFNALFVR